MMNRAYPITSRAKVPPIFANEDTAQIATTHRALTTSIISANQIAGETTNPEPSHPKPCFEPKGARRG
jgi:hypothetical protein